MNWFLGRRVASFDGNVCLFLQKQVVKKQGGKKKKQTLKFTLDCTHPVEDGIMDAANFVSRAELFPCAADPRAQPRLFPGRVSWLTTTSGLGENS